jgi:hypothetical protein
LSPWILERIFPKVLGIRGPYNKQTKMKIKHKKQLEVLWMEGSRRDPRKTFEKKQKNKFPEVLWMEGPAKSL